MEEIKLITDLADAGKRLDVYLSEYLEGYSRTYAQRLIDQELVRVDGRPVKRSFRLEGEEELSFQIPENEALKIEAEDIPLEIVYEDDWLMVVNKPKGMVVHPAPGHQTGTLVNAVMYHAGSSLSGINGVLRPGIVHRIDRDTTGLLLVCKNDKAHESIAAQLKEHSIKRRYTALAEGRFPDRIGTVDAPIGRDRKNRLRMAVDRESGKEAVTHYEVREQYRKYALLYCRLETGRTHQIRVHLASLGHPLAGDLLYGGHSLGSETGQYLHAGLLGFRHPQSGAYLEFEAPLPAYFADRLTLLRKETESMHAAAEDGRKGEAR
ncbi:MAG: RluA family pseudouridine synthase [Lachnospiraceae bacterium]|nr:RluA family pseudouridine synthase [Lachnospiraceae bacterium]